MKRVRVIPIIMIDQGRAVITRQFKKPVYVGDPINSIKIFNDKEVDELIILDITDKKKRREPDFKLIEKMASESFMPLAYGGNVTRISDAEAIINCGIEKICFNTSLFTNPEVVRELSHRNGKQSVVASLDVSRSWLSGYKVKTHGGEKSVAKPLDSVIDLVVELGVGELLINSIDKDGSREGYDQELITRVTSRVKLPVIACGGASGISDFVKAVNESGASAVAAGAMFFFKGGFNAVLVNYPDQPTLRTELYDQLD
jgi:imidazole glycerol-phosphate synthase subunit HisF